MKLLQEKQENHSRGISSIHEYEVLNNSKIMNMLSSQLYSDKIISPIRELVANAYDSLVLSNNLDKKITIILPSPENLEFKIRDYGTGLSENQLINLYRFYGLSDKDKTNTMIGMMGIGSKSPWAYTHVFTTTSYHNGVKYIYVNNKMGRNGVPELCKLYEEPTDELNGLEVSFAVNKYDIAKFAEKTAEILQHFPDVFTIIDDTNHYSSYKNANKNEILFEGNDWKIGNKRGAYAIMGYIAYPITFSKLQNNHLQLSDINLLLDFNIGDLGVNLGREELEYTPKTIKNIVDKLEIVKVEIKDNIQEKLKDCKCYFDACKIYAQSPYYLQKLFGLLDYKGRKIDYCLYLNNHIMKYFMRYGRVKRGSTSYISCKDDIQFYINDLNTGSQKLVNEVLKQHPNKVLYVKPINNSNKQKEVDEFCLELGIPEDRLIYLSELAKQYKVTTKRTYTKSTNALTLEYIPTASNYNKSNFWKQVDIDLKNGGYYFETTGNDIIIDGVKKDPGTFKYIFEHCENLKLKPPTIYGLRPSHVKKIKKNPNWGWKSFQEWIDEQILVVKPLVSKEEIEKYYYWANLAYGIGDAYLKLYKEQDFQCEDIIELCKLDRAKVRDYINFMNSVACLGSIYHKYIIKTHNKTIEKYKILDDTLRYFDKKDKKQIIFLFNSLNSFHNKGESV